MEIDARLILQDRANGVPDEDIFETLLRDSGGSLTVDDFTMDLSAAKQSGDSVSSIMDFITSGKALRTKDNVDAGIASSSIDSQPEALLSGAATGVTNLMGLPVDLVNMGLQAGEGLVRKGLNTVGVNASTDPDDFYKMRIDRHENTVQIHVPTISNTYAEIQWTATPGDHQSWKTLEVPENTHFYPASSTLRTIDVSKIDLGSAFFRVRLREL